MKKINLKNLKFGVNNTVVVAFAVALVILLNVIVNLAETKVPSFKLDLTEDAVTKISSETKELLKKVDEKDIDIELIYLVGTGEGNERVTDILEQYDAYCENVTSRTVNYHSDPLFLSGYGIPSDVNVDGAVIVATSDKSKIQVVYAENMEMSIGGVMVFFLENLLTKSIGVISTDRQMNVGFTTSHGEVVSKMLTNAQGQEEAGGAMLLSLLDNENVVANPVNLTGDLSEYDMIVVLAPESDFTMPEINVLDDYMLEGGNALVCLPYGVKLERLEDYLATWGLTAENNLVTGGKDTSVNENGTYFFANTTESELVSGISERIIASYARSLTHEEAGDVEAEALVVTGNDAVAVPIENGGYDMENSKMGQFDLAYKLERPVDDSWEETSKLTVLGTPSLIGVAERLDDEYSALVSYALTEESFGNSDFVMSILSDAFGETIQSITVPLKSRSVSILNFTEVQAVWMQRIFCFILPVGVLLLGAAVWLKRRNK